MSSSQPTVRRGSTDPQVQMKLLARELETVRIEQRRLKKQLSQSAPVTPAHSPMQPEHLVATIASAIAQQSSSKAGPPKCSQRLGSCCCWSVDCAWFVFTWGCKIGVLFSIIGAAIAFWLFVLH